MPLLLHPSSTCDVCLEPYTGTNVPHAIACGHVFCQQCLDCLMQYDCPVCRKGFSPCHTRRLYLECGPSMTSTEAVPPTAAVLRANESVDLLEAIARTIKEGGKGDKIQRLLDECKVNYDSQPDSQSTSVRVCHLLLHNLLEAQKKLDVQAEQLHEVNAVHNTTPMRRDLASSLSIFKQNVLLLEVAVRRDPTNAAAWFELGVKQQENKRDAKAIPALRRAVELDPSYLPAWRALAVSYINEGDNLQVYHAMQEWAMQNPRYEATVSGSTLATNTRGDFTGLIDLLIQAVTEDDVDADLLIVLALLMYVTGEYTRALNYIHAALDVRPDDWWLYNFAGTTLAIDGQNADALAYYLQALDLNPVYIRARSNLGLCCMQLEDWEEAASHLLDALVLQDNDGLPEGMSTSGLRGETSMSLWDNLKTCCEHLHRDDMESMCDRRDLDGVRQVFSRT